MSHIVQRCVGACAIYCVQYQFCLCLRVAEPARKEKPRKVYKQLVLPTPEQMQQEDLMNNCGVRTVLSGVMGAGLGLVFGVFMVTMDAAVRPRWRR